MFRVQVKILCRLPFKYLSNFSFVKEESTAVHDNPAAEDGNDRCGMSDEVPQPESDTPNPEAAVEDNSDVTDQPGVEGASVDQEVPQHRDSTESQTTDGEVTSQGGDATEASDGTHQPKQEDADGGEHHETSASVTSFPVGGDQQMTGSCVSEEEFVVVSRKDGESETGAADRDDHNEKTPTAVVSITSLPTIMLQGTV